MEDKITIFHGSEKVIEKPEFGIMISGLDFTVHKRKSWQRNGPFPLSTMDIAIAIILRQST